MATIINRAGSSAVVHVTANDTVVIAGNSSISNVASGNSSVYETLTGGSIKKVFWGSTGVGGNSYWTVARGSNTVLVLPGSGSMDFAASGCSLIKDAAANVVLTLTGSTLGFIMVEIQKTPTVAG